MNGDIKNGDDIKYIRADIADEKDKRIRVLERALEDTNRLLFKEKVGHNEWSDGDRRAYLRESIAQAEQELETKNERRR